MAYDDQNIFAKILRGEAPCIKIDEDEYTLAFMDIMPQAEGHALVIPKFPAENIFALSPDYAQHAIRQTQRIATAAKKAFNCAGIIIAQLNGEAAGQTVFHLHFHIIPRYEKTPTIIMPVREMADQEKLKAQAEKIKAALS